MFDFKTNVSCVLESVFAGFKDENIKIACDNITELYVSELEKIKSEILFSEINSRGYITYAKALDHCCGIIDKHMPNQPSKSEPDDFHEYWDEMAISRTNIK